MKPHDEWNSADIADHARRAMHLEITDYGEEPPRERPVPPALILAGGVMGWLLFGWVVVKLWGMW
jgi:hypothetical protein